MLNTIKKIVSLCESESYAHTDAESAAVGDHMETMMSVGKGVSNDGNDHHYHDSVLETMVSIPFEIGNKIPSNAHHAQSILEDLRRTIRMKLECKSASAKNIIEREGSNSKMSSTSNCFQNQVASIRQQHDEIDSGGDS